MEAIFNKSHNTGSHTNTSSYVVDLRIKKPFNKPALDRKAHLKY